MGLSEVQINETEIFVVVNTEDENFYPNTKKDFTISDLEYICKYYHHDSVNTIGLALGRKPSTIKAIVREMKKEELFDYYKNLNIHW